MSTSEPAHHNPILKVDPLAAAVSMADMAASSLLNPMQTRYNRSIHTILTHTTLIVTQPLSFLVMSYSQTDFSVWISHLLTHLYTHTPLIRQRATATHFKIRSWGSFCTGLPPSRIMGTCEARNPVSSALRFDFKLRVSASSVLHSIYCTPLLLWAIHSLLSISPILTQK